MPPELEDTIEIEAPEALDMEAAQAEIASELFGQGAEVSELKEGEDADGKVTPTDDTVAPPPEDRTVEGGGQTSETGGAELGLETAAPSTWSKAAAEKWAGIDPTIQAEIAKREEDMFRGLEQYKGRAELGDRYEGVIAEFKPILEAEGIDSVEMFGNFAANHYLLSRGTPEQKLEVAANLLNHYGIHPDLIKERLGTRPEANPEVDALRAEIAELKKGVTTITTRETEAQQAQFRQAVDAFSADPAHPYFNEVATDIATLLKTGVATTLEEAYDKAVYANPVTRQKEIDRLTAEGVSAATEQEKTRNDKKARLTASNVTTIPKSANGTVPVGSMDDTLAATLAAIEARG